MLVVALTQLIAAKIPKAPCLVADMVEPVAYFRRNP